MIRSERVTSRLVIASVLVAALAVSGCGGSKVLKESQPMQLVQPLAVATDPSMTATLDWVIVRDGPGTWAKNADWDEYILRLHNHGEAPVTVERLVLTDSLANPHEPMADRKALVKASKATHKRYRKASRKVRAGYSGVGLFAAGVATTVVGTAAAVTVAETAILAGSASTGAAGVVAGGLVLAGPALVVGGIVRSANHGKVDQEIKRRHSPLPILLPAGEESRHHVFFPLAPSPIRLEVHFRDEDDNKVLPLDLREALDGLHLDTAASR